MSLRKVCTFLLFASVLLATSCERKNSSVGIRLKWIDQAQFAGFYYASDAGLYAKRSLNVVLRPGGVDFPAVPLVASGSDQFGVTGADQVLLARAKGIPIVAVAAIYRETPFVLFSLKKSAITKMDDLRGRKVGVKLGGNEEFTYRVMMKAAKVPNSFVTEVPVKFDITPLLSGQLDVWPGYSINEPIAAQEQGYDVSLIAPREYGIHLYADVLFTTEQMIQQHPDTVRGVVQASMEGWTSALSNKEQAVTYTLRHSAALKHDHEMKMLVASEPLIRSDSRPIGTMDIRAWQDMQQMMLDQQFLTAPLDVSHAFTNRFLEGSEKQ